MSKFREGYMPLLKGANSFHEIWILNQFFEGKWHKTYLLLVLSTTPCGVNLYEVSHYLAGFDDAGYTVIVIR